MTQTTNLFERLRLQAHLRTLIQTLGETQALAVIGSAIEKELQYADFQRDLEQHAHSLRNHTDLHTR